MKTADTGVILAGGRNTRFDGVNKAFLEVGQRTIFDLLYERLASLFTNLIVVTNSPEEYLDWDCEIVSDVYPASGSLVGLHTGLFFFSVRIRLFYGVRYAVFEKKGDPSAAGRNRTQRGCGHSGHIGGTGASLRRLFETLPETHGTGTGCRPA